jgi:hypothetical protein
MSPKVVAVIEPVLETLGTGPDPVCWVIWGDDPAVRYSILAPTPAGLVVGHIRVNVPQEGPRAGGKLVRWSRVQTGELGVEMAEGHRLLSFQVEGQILRGTDDDAAEIAAFALDLFAMMDGRTAGSVTAAASEARPRGRGARGATPAPAGRTGSSDRPLQLPPPSPAT